MALTLDRDSEIEEKNSSLKVEGDLGSYQVVKVEERSDCEDDEGGSQSSRTTNTLSTLPSDLVKPSVPSVIGKVSVKNSENVQFGNNTYFNGPVTIKQIIQNNSEHDNLGYEPNEAETTGDPIRQEKTEAKLSNGTNDKPLQIQLWLKLTFSAVCVVIVGSICAIVTVSLNNSGQDIVPNTSFNEDSTSNCAMVEGVCYNIKNINLFLFPISMILLTCLWYGLFNLVTNQSLLTKDMVRSDNAIYLKSEAMKNKYKAEDPLLIAPNHLRIVSRTDWLARPVEKPLDVLRQPVPWVIITHTDTESCTTQSECVLRVRLIQMFHVESRGWFDIGYNFLVAGDGSAYYGRGWDYQGAHTLGYNKYSIGIAFVGTFNTKPPPKKQIEACQKLIKRGVEMGKLAKDYKLFGHRQLASTLSPGDKLYDIIKEWPHFVGNYSDISELVPNY